MFCKHNKAYIPLVMELEQLHVMIDYGLLVMEHVITLFRYQSWSLLTSIIGY